MTISLYIEQDYKKTKVINVKLTHFALIMNNNGTTLDGKFKYLAESNTG